MNMHVPNTLISGRPGSGKSATLQNLVASVQGEGVPIVEIDAHATPSCQDHLLRTASTGALIVLDDSTPATVGRTVALAANRSDLRFAAVIEASDELSSRTVSRHDMVRLVGGDTHGQEE